MRVFLILGVLPLLLTVALTARIVWEQTVLTWERGPQMIGFSLAHGPYGLLLLAPVLLAPWVLTGCCIAVAQRLKGRAVDRRLVATIAISAVTLGLLSTPQTVWWKAFPNRLATSPAAGEFLTYSAMAADRSIINLLLSRGVRADATDSKGNNALHAVAGSVHDDAALAEFFVAQGTPLDPVNQMGDSPLNVARRSTPKVAAVLERHGAKRAP